MYLTKLKTGTSFNLYALVTKNTCLVKEFVDSLEERYKKQVLALLKKISEKGPLTNEEKFRNLGDGIWELKTKGGIRILAFFGGALLPRSLILTHGFKKPKKKVLEREKQKAVEWYKEYQNETVEIK